MDKDTGNNSELKHADTRCGGQENIKEKEQAGASVATKCTVSTVTDCKRQTALQTNINLIHIYTF